MVRLLEQQQAHEEVQRSPVHQVLRSPGRPMAEPLRAEMEARLGADFTDVRLHDDSTAARSAAEIGARAYTSGRHVVIGAGGGDRHTLAHELTHVIQQRTGPVAGSRDSSGLSVSDPGDAFERAAEANAARVLSRPIPARSAVEPVGATSPLGHDVQRRADNPYARVEQHQGWELTAHHIVAHSTLLDALGRLDARQRAAVLARAIPTTITDAMLDNLKVAKPKDPADWDAFRRDLRDRLVGPEPDEVTVSEIKLGDMRQSFFEWQGGNQFPGPNTSIRPEPSASKDDIDADGKYFTRLSEADFVRLTELGKELRTDLDAGRTFDRLEAMLSLTKDIAPPAFDPAAWIEIGTLPEVEQLAADKALNRQHIFDYTYFKLPLADIGPTKTYRAFSTAGGDYFYDGLQIPLQAKGTLGYIPLTAGDIATVREVQESLKTVLTALNVPFASGTTPSDLVIVKPTAAIAVTGKKFTVAGYDGDVPCTVLPDTTVGVQSVLFEKKKVKSKTVIRGASLRQYCVANGLPTSTYLPDALHKTLTGGTP
ncbi:DUF4157 domain-containing protein [Kitasatospora sp. MAA4]|uniref:eCIS core domain-containing protein n=1 Tax=Kitasatospora sp. MAA4 TaxID=3035093 RepID=UPI0024769CA8|nr:DUF4157 domain-containing protein [Kitasatospora sp. MAA4]